MPRSRTNPQFNREILPQGLGRFQILRRCARSNGRTREMDRCDRVVAVRVAYKEGLKP
jgi:hypothetical protein